MWSEAHLSVAVVSDSFAINRMEVRTVHTFLAACLRTHKDVYALAEYIMCDTAYSTFTELVLAILTDPIRVRLVICNVGATFRISVFLTETLRITSGFLEKMENRDAFLALSSLLEHAPRMFAISRANPVLRTLVYEDITGREQLNIPRVMLAQALIARQAAYVKTKSVSAVSGWKKELMGALGPAFVEIINTL